MTFTNFPKDCGEKCLLELSWSDIHTNYSSCADVKITEKSQEESVNYNSKINERQCGIDGKSCTGIPRIIL